MTNQDSAARVRDMAQRRVNRARDLGEEPNPMDLAVLGQSTEQPTVTVRPVVAPAPYVEVPARLPWQTKALIVFGILVLIALLTRPFWKAYIGF